jgi:type I restriction enzyme S subunit
VLQSEWRKSGVPFYRAREIVKLSNSGWVDNDLFIAHELYEKYAKNYDAPISGDLMVSAVGTLGACYIVKPDDKFYYKDASVLQFRSKINIDPRYFWHVFKTQKMMDQVNAGSGSTVGTLTISRAKELKLNLPPLDEQKRIAAILDQADDIRCKRQHAIDRLNQLGQAIFHEMFGRGDSSAIPLSDYFEEIRMGPFGSMLHKSDYVDGGIPLINPMHITDGKIAPNPKFSIEPRKAKELSSYRLKEGDVVVGRRGEMGRCAVVLAAHDGYLCGTGSMFLRAAFDKADPFFITELIKSKNVIKKIEAVASGVTMMNLNSTSFDRVMVPKISIEEQQAYFKRVRFISDSMQTLKNHLSRTNYLFASLQHRAFTGQL